MGNEAVHDHSARREEMHSADPAVVSDRVDRGVEEMQVEGVAGWKIAVAVHAHRGAVRGRRCSAEAPNLRMDAFAVGLAILLRGEVNEARLALKVLFQWVVGKRVGSGGMIEGALVGEECVHVGRTSRGWVKRCDRSRDTSSLHAGAGPGCVT